MPRRCCFFCTGFFLPFFVQSRWMLSCLYLSSASPSFHKRLNRPSFVSESFISTLMDPGFSSPSFVSQVCHINVHATGFVAQPSHHLQVRTQPHTLMSVRFVSCSGALKTMKFLSLSFLSWISFMYSFL